jgi:hypothetical protein
MKSISGTMLALIFIFLSLISLLSVNPTWDDGFSALPDDQARVSEIGLRFALAK